LVILNRDTYAIRHVIGEEQWDELAQLSSAQRCGVDQLQLARVSGRLWQSSANEMLPVIIYWLAGRW